MPIRKPKPTSPGRRFVTYPDFAEITRSEPEKSLDRGAQEVRRTQRLRAQDLTPPRRRRQAPVPQDRLQAPARTASRRRSPQIEYDPNRTALHRAAPLRRRREALHPRPGAAEGRRDRRVRPGRRHQASATACRLTNIPPGTLVHNVELTAGPRWAAGALGRHRASSCSPRTATTPRCAFPRARCGMVRARVPRDDRHGRQLRPPEREDRQGRAQAPHGRAPAVTRHGDEPGRPPARWRRGLDDGGPPPGHPMGRADARISHPQEGQGIRPVHRARTEKG